MNTKEIAQKLVDYCRKSDWRGAHHELYAENAKSIEPFETKDFKKETLGMKEIDAKGKKFDDMIQKVHNINVSEPLVVGNTIAFTLGMDVTMKDGQRMNNPEICVYQVKDGKIVSEEFFV